MEKTQELGDRSLSAERIYSIATPYVIWGYILIHGYLLINIMPLLINGFGYAIENELHTINDIGLTSSILGDWGDIAQITVYLSFVLLLLTRVSIFVIYFSSLAATLFTFTTALWAIVNLGLCCTEKDIAPHYSADVYLQHPLEQYIALLVMYCIPTAIQLIGLLSERRTAPWLKLMQIIYLLPMIGFPLALWLAYILKM